MDEKLPGSKPCGAALAWVEPGHSQPERAMSTVAAICVIAFLAFMAILNKVEFGHFD